MPRYTSSVDGGAPIWILLNLIGPDLLQKGTENKGVPRTAAEDLRVGLP